MALFNRNGRDSIDRVWRRRLRYCAFDLFEGIKLAVLLVEMKVFLEERAMKIETLVDGKSWRVWAPAKINLFFEILGKRSDGYHEIATVVAPISLYDRLEFERVDRVGLSLQCFDADGRPDSEIPCDERNLVSKAYRVFYEEARFLGRTESQVGYLCKIFKKIPSKAGLGGGSSDAAAALLVFNKANGNFFPKDKLQELASRIGSDVPLFLEEGASVGRGRGEVVEPIELPPLWLTILKPLAGLSTPAVYRQYAETSHSSPRSLEEFCSHVARANALIRGSIGTSSVLERSGGEVASISHEAAFEIASRLSNRLEEPASALWQGFGIRRKLLASTGALAVQMSGSGTAFFAVFCSEQEARDAAGVLSSIIDSGSDPELIGERVFVARTL